MVIDGDGEIPRDFTGFHHAIGYYRINGAN
jgi:hypothetical protein